jgi:SNF2 family DNA or RNA helicase
MSRLWLFFLFTFVSCSQFHTGRTYLSEMEHDDSRFFSPNEDFPVVAGDSGRTWNSEREQRERTPASEEDVAEVRAKRSLRQELADLENRQTEENLKLYEAHLRDLPTVSERIYFLKLSPYDRKDYLMARGLIREPKRSRSFDPEKSFRLRDQALSLGMSKTQVLQSWGEPARVDIAGNPSNENERWLYSMNGASKYIYFEAGEVQGWE